MTKYAIGFMIDYFHSPERVLLIRKERPNWQKGKFNGVGGHVEEGEDPTDAMRREFLEEAGLDREWTKFAVVEYDDCELHCFVCYVDDWTGFESKTDETVFEVPVSDVQSIDSVPDVKWMVPFCLNAAHHLKEPITLKMS